MFVQQKKKKSFSSACNVLGTKKNNNLFSFPASTFVENPSLCLHTDTLINHTFKRLRVNKNNSSPVPMKEIPTFYILEFDRILICMYHFFVSYQ